MKNSIPQVPAQGADIAFARQESSTGYLLKKHNWLCAMRISQTVSPSAFIVAHTVAEYINRETGCCHPALDSLATFSGLSRKTVQRAIPQLKDAGWFDAIQHPGGTYEFKARWDRANGINTSVSKVNCDAVRGATREVNLTTPEDDDPGQSDLPTQVRLTAHPGQIDLPTQVRLTPEHGELDTGDRNAGERDTSVVRDQPAIVPANDDRRDLESAKPESKQRDRRHVAMSLEWDPDDDTMTKIRSVYADAEQHELQMPHTVNDMLAKFRSYHMRHATNSNDNFAGKMRGWVEGDRKKAFPRLETGTATGEPITLAWWPSDDAVEKAKAMYGQPSNDAWTRITNHFVYVNAAAGTRSEDPVAFWLEWLGTDLQSLANGKDLRFDSISARKVVDELWMPSTRTIREIIETHGPFSPDDHRKLKIEIDDFIKRHRRSRPANPDAKFKYELNARIDKGQFRLSTKPIRYAC